jgi:hypothetical protein
MIIGGSNINTFYNTGPTAEDSIEFFPSRPGEAGTVRPSQFLLDAEPVNMFPRYSCSYKNLHSIQCYPDLSSFLPGASS